MYKNVFLSIIIIIFSYTLLFAVEPLSDGYKDIKLGMTQNQVKNILKKTTEFNVKKEEVLSIRIEPDTEIISTEGYGFVNYGYFHFNDDKLFQILLKLSEEKLGYYLLLKRLTGRFGKPNDFTPKRASWENEQVKIIVEKPCTIKYIYLPVWSELIKNDLSKDTVLDSVRKKFVDDL